MEMIAGEDIDGIGEDLTPQIPPICFSLFDSFLNSRCSSCFRPLPLQKPHHHLNTLFYCSSSCFHADSSIHYSSSEHHLFLLLQSQPSTWHAHSTSDLRSALRLLLHFHRYLPPLSQQSYLPRIGGLLSNRENLLANDEEMAARVRDGGRLMSLARRMRDGRDVAAEEEGGGGYYEENNVEEETALCIVLTNAVEVQVDEQGPIGIAVYGQSFSWINHSCSPNTCYRFSTFDSRDSGESRTRIVASGYETILREGISEECESKTDDFTIQNVVVMDQE